MICNFPSEPDIPNVIIPSEEDIFYGKTAKELFSDLELVGEGKDKKVTGTLNYVNEYTNFKGKKTGFYFPFLIEGSGNTMTFKKNGKVLEESISFKKDNVFLITSKKDTFEILIDNESIVTLDFSDIIFGKHTCIENNADVVYIGTKEECYKLVYNCELCGEFIREDPPVGHDLYRDWDLNVMKCSRSRCNYTEPLS